MTGETGGAGGARGAGEAKVADTSLELFSVVYLGQGKRGLPSATPNVQDRQAGQGPW